MNKNLFNKIGFIKLLPIVISDNIYSYYIDLYYYIFKKQHNIKYKPYKSGNYTFDTSILYNLLEITKNIREILDGIYFCYECNNFRKYCKCYANINNKIYKVYIPRKGTYIWTIMTTEQYKIYNSSLINNI
jgi:hypothetical protein